MEEEQDPDYQLESAATDSQVAVSESQPSISSNLPQQKTSKDVNTILEKLFSDEETAFENDIYKTDKHLNESRLLIDRLRALLVVNLYSKTSSGAGSSRSLKGQPEIHPAVKREIGKSIPNAEPLLNPPLSLHTISSEEKQARKPARSKPASRSQDEQPTKKLQRVIVGNVNKYLPESTRDKKDQASYKWMVYVRGPRDKPDISDIVDKVWFFLHPSYKPNDLVEVNSYPFHLTRRGWGEFPLRVQLHLKNSRQRRVDIIHHLKLDRLHTGVQQLGSETHVDVEFDHSNPPATMSQVDLKTEPTVNGYSSNLPSTYANMENSASSCEPLTTGTTIKHGSPIKNNTPTHKRSIPSDNDGDYQESALSDPTCDPPQKLFKLDDSGSNQNAASMTEEQPHLTSKSNGALNTDEVTSPIITCPTDNSNSRFSARQQSKGLLRQDSINSQTIQTPHNNERIKECVPSTSSRRNSTVQTRKVSINYVPVPKTGQKLTATSNGAVMTLQTQSFNIAPLGNPRNQASPISRPSGPTKNFSILPQPLQSYPATQQGKSMVSLLKPRMTIAKAVSAPSQGDHSLSSTRLPSQKAQVGGPRPQGPQGPQPTNILKDPNKLPMIFKARLPNGRMILVQRKLDPSQINTSLSQTSSKSPADRKQIHGLKRQSENQPMPSAIYKAQKGCFPSFDHLEDTEQLVKALLKCYPLTIEDEKEFPLIHPSKERFITLPHAKRRSLEWQRCKTIQRHLSRICKSLTSPNKDSVYQIWTTKQIMIYSRRHLYTPHVPGDSCWGCQLLPHQNHPQPHLFTNNLIDGLITTDQSDDIDILWWDTPTAKRKQSEDMKNSENCLSNPTQEDQFISELCTHVTNKPMALTEISPGLKINMASKLLFFMYTKFMEDLIRCSASNVVLRDSESLEIADYHVIEAIKSRGAFNVINESLMLCSEDL